MSHTPDDLNPQAQQMADESMVRNLAAQAEAIWPQEAPLFARYALPPDARVLDAGCGTGEITARLAARNPGATLLGVDILEGPLRLARERHADLAPRVRFEQRSVFDLGLPDASFDLTVCRHVVQAIPHVERALAELRRVTRPGGHLHLIAEDYGMIHFPVGETDPGSLFPAGPVALAAATNTDQRIGRHVYGILRRLGLTDITIDYVVVDTLRVPRAIFASIWEAWRDGYTDILAAHLHRPREAIAAQFDAMISTIRDPDGYAVWFVPVVAARVP